MPPERAVLDATDTTLAPVENRPADSRIAGWSLGGLRILMGLMWLQNVGWKQPPFSRQRGFGHFVEFGVTHEVFGPFAWVSKHVILPNLSVFGWAVLFLELSLAVFLLLGLATRFWALVGVAQGVAITLSVLNAPHEWGWSYWMIIGIHLVLAATAAGRVVGLDAVMRPIWRSRPGRISTILARCS